MNNSAITFIMIAHDSPTTSQYLVRCLSFYRQFHLHILILDGAKESRSQLVNDVGNPEIEYFHLPDQSVVDRIQFGFDRVRTPYIKLLTIDDFYIPSGIEACLSFLDENPSYTTAWGTSICYRETDFNIEYFLLDTWSSDYDSNAADPLDRIQYFWENSSYQCPFGVFRLEAYHAAIELSKTAPVEFNLIERVVLTSVAAFGKSKRLKVPFAVKESRSNSLGTNTIPLNELIHLDEHADKLEHFYTSLSALARKYPTSQPLPLADYTQKIFLSILNWYSVTLHKKWVLPKLFTSTWDIAQNVPKFRFEPDQYIDCGLYTPSFFAQLHQIDFGIRAHGICATENDQKLDSLLEKISPIVDKGQFQDAEQLLMNIYRLTPFHRNTLALLKRVYTYSGQLDRVLQVNAWEQKLQREVYFP